MEMQVIKDFTAHYAAQNVITIMAIFNIVLN